MTTRQLPYAEAPTDTRLRRAVAIALHGASLALGQLARRLLPGERAARTADPVFEFCAQAGAPEGALYVDGQLVGTLTGVSRL